MGGTRQNAEFLGMHVRCSPALGARRAGFWFAPLAFDCELVPDHLLDALGGNREQGRFEPDEIGAGGDASRNVQQRRLLRRGDDELTGNAARGMVARRGKLRAGVAGEIQKRNNDAAN